jgi:hypothetical protein
MNTEQNITCTDLPDELQPCGHMVNLVSRRSDESLAGPAKWYTDFHVLTCPHCRAALKGLRQLRAEVTELASTPVPEELKLGEDEWKKIEATIRE